ncbi:hypothetical protein HHL22_06765 [Hymenobacter sp. RP-2-7]|uniref:Uncharacterized protein n=1 Tax=Hymenobacter polaris TaxID=2682546 RepID=A0A7Y0FLW6_9BACT|nr:DUF6348 family protein [Hymenobacter polaris]NML64905.1 hypothetical protein [Hymenobacter polaris]
MNLLRKLQQLFQPAKAIIAPPAIKQSSAAEVNQLFQQELLTIIQQQFSALLPVLTEQGIALNPVQMLLETEVLELTRHPNALVGGFAVRLSQPDYFPQGMMECLAGIGQDETTAATAAAKIYVEGVLATVLEAFEGRHDAALDVVSPHDGAVWHPILGLLYVQGAWVARSQELIAEYLFEQLKPLLLEHLQPQPFHWVKVYASRQRAKTFIGECQLDNEPWEAGLQHLEAITAAWPAEWEFAAQKQFILLRRCGLCQPRNLADE